MRIALLSCLDSVERVHQDIPGGAANTTCKHSLGPLIECVRVENALTWRYGGRFISRSMSSSCPIAGFGTLFCRAPLI